MKKILFSTDFSDNSLHAAKYAVLLAERLNADIIFLNVYSVPVFTEYQIPYDMAGLEQMSRENADNNISNFVDKLISSTKFPKDKTAQMVESGVTTDNILGVAEREKVDMIVMGTKGTSNMLERWLGTNAQKIVETANIPVWVIPSKAKLIHPTSVLYAADFKEDEVEATHTILEFVTPLAVVCKVVHIHEYYQPDVGNVVRNTTEKLEEVFQFNDITFKNLKRYDVVKGLETYIKTNKPDVLAMATHEKSFFERFFITSISDHFIQQADLPMLTFRKGVFV